MSLRDDLKGIIREQEKKEADKEEAEKIKREKAALFAERQIDDEKVEKLANEKYNDFVCSIKRKVNDKVISSKPALIGQTYFYQEYELWRVNVFTSKTGFSPLISFQTQAGTGALSSEKHDTRDFDYYCVAYCNNIENLKKLIDRLKEKLAKEFDHVSIKWEKDRCFDDHFNKVTVDNVIFDLRISCDKNGNLK